MKVLVLGGGGREHALAWRIAQDPQVQKVVLHPGNDGTARAGFASLGDIALSSIDMLVAEAHRQMIDLVVVGPEVLLAQGFSDRFRREGFLVVGPGQAGAQLETSKAFAKHFLEDGKIPTAHYETASSPATVREKTGDKYPVVLKLDGLAAGKGVVVAESEADREDFINRVWDRKEFGAGPHTVVVEQFLAGRELSYIGLCDGERFVALSTASDYKRVFDGNLGPNTGGMGAISPSPVANSELEKRIQEKIVTPTLKQLKRRGLDYRGALYFGLMICDGEPYVLEFNTRFGDPETQALMLRLEGNFTDLLCATAKAELTQAPAPQFKPGACVYVVAAAAGYPAEPKLGDAIEGLDAVPAGVQVFFSGVRASGSKLVTHGGRVMGLGATGPDAEACRRQVYTAFEKTGWKTMHYRRDIGA